MENTEIRNSPSSQSDGERRMEQHGDRNKEDYDHVLSLDDVRSRVQDFVDEKFPRGCLGALVDAGPAGNIDRVSVLKNDLMRAVDDFFRKHMRDRFDE